MNQENKEFLLSIEAIRCRMTGKTTRMVDDFVQNLYKNEGEWIGIHDHYPSRNADRMVFEKVIKRMMIEHPQDKIEIDKLNNRIKLTWCQRDGLVEEEKREIEELKEYFPLEVLDNKEIEQCQKLSKNGYTSVVKYLKNVHPEMGLKECKIYYDLYFNND